MYLSKKSENRGFTLLEMLMVIAIIGIFSAVVLAAVRSSRDRAQYTAIAQQFQELNTAFTVWMTDEDRTTWWDETDFGLGNNPTIADLIANTDFQRYFSTAATPALGTEFQYDNDSDTHGGCTTDYDRGANIVLTDVTPVIAAEVDLRIDQGDGNQCGRIKWNPAQTVIFYELSDNGVF